MTPAQVENPEKAFQPDGYFPAVTNRPGEHVWGSYGNQGDQTMGDIHLHFSRPSHGRWLELFVAGQPNSSGMSLTLTDEHGLTSNIAPSRNPQEQWISVFVRAPDGAFVIAASDHNTGTWLALTAPREIDTGTLIARFFQVHSIFIACLGIALLALGSTKLRPLQIYDQ
jgi:hypothetical protein